MSCAVDPARARIAILLVAACVLPIPLSVPTAVGAQAIPLDQRPWTGSVIVPSGGPIIPIFDGWYENADRSHTLCFGYYSTNSEEEVTIPLGSGNFVEPAIYGGRQPDTFEPIPESPFRYRRRYCVFPVRVPPDFGDEDRVVWTLQRGRGEAVSVPGKLVPMSRLDEPTSPGRGNVAPTLRFGSADGPVAHGRSGITVGPYRVAVGDPLQLEVHVDHPAEEVWVGWAKQQGPGPVTFSEQNTVAEGSTKIARATVRFAMPGLHLLRIQSIDDPVEAFEFHCCWTNVFVEVIVEE